MIEDDDDYQNFLATDVMPDDTVQDYFIFPPEQFDRAERKPQLTHGVKPWEFDITD